VLRRLEEVSQEKGKKQGARTGGEGALKKTDLLLIIDFAGLAILTRADLVWCSGGQEIAVPCNNRNRKSEWS